MRAVKHEIEATHTYVFTAQHLAAIALQTGRAKDKARLLQFVAFGSLDDSTFQEILARFELVKKWHKFKRQFLEDVP